MPTLRNITCRLMWPEGTQFKEVATTYGDGIVETYIPIPSDRPQKFYINVRSRGYIYEGLAVVVFIDGVYQCNRNRVNLVRPKNGKPVYAPEPIKRGPRKGQQINLSEVEWNIRQEEKPLDRRTHFLGSDWRFDDFKKVEDNTAPDSTEENFQGLGTIDVIILRCAPNPKDKVSPTDYDSGAESDVLNNNLTEDDAAKCDPPKVAGKEKKDGSKNKKEQHDGSDKEEKAKQPNQGKQKGGKNDKGGGDKGKSGGKGDGGGKGGGGGGKGNSEQAAKGDKGSQGKQDKKKPAEKPKAAEDDDDEPASIASFDGPADEYYRGNQYYSDPGWPGYANANHYGYSDPAGSAQRPPPHHPQGKHVHWDMGPGQPRPPEPQRHDYYAGAYAQSNPVPGYATQSGYGQYPSYDYNHGQHQYQQPPPYAQPHGVADPYQSHQGQHYPPSGYPPNPQHYPAPTQHGPAHAPAPVPARYPPQVGYQHWPQYYGGTTGTTSQPTNQPAQEAQSNIEEAGGWKYVEPKRKTEPPPTITNFNGWQFDPAKGTWVPDTGKPSDQKNDQGGGDPTNNDGWTNTTNNDQGKDWTNTTNNDQGKDWTNTSTNDKSDEWTSGTTNDNQNDEKKDDDSWGDSKDSDKNDTNGDSGKNDDWGDSKNDENDWGKDQGNTQGGASDSNDAGWGDTSNTQSNGAAESKPTPTEDVPRADRTLHGPLGAYFGPKIAVEQDPDVPWVADEPPAYDLPNFIVKKLGISKQVQRGKGYNHVKKHRKPIYIDSIAEPYARFVFKYRTRDKLPRGFDKLESLEPTPDHVIQQLQEKKKEDLIAELQRWRLAYGDKAPELKIDLKPQETPDHAAWNLDLPKRDYLNYQLPGQFPDEAPAKTDNSSQNNSSQNTTSQVTDSWDSNTNDNGQKSDQAWDGGNTATTDSGNAGWDSGNTGGGGSDPKSGW